MNFIIRYVMGKYLLHPVWILYLSLPPSSSEYLVILASSLIKQVFHLLIFLINRVTNLKFV